MFPWLFYFFKQPTALWPSSPQEKQWLHSGWFLSTHFGQPWGFSFLILTLFWEYWLTRSDGHGWLCCFIASAMLVRSSILAASSLMRPVFVAIFLDCTKLKLCAMHTCGLLMRRTYPLLSLTFLRHSWTEGALVLGIYHCLYPSPW